MNFININKIPDSAKDLLINQSETGMGYHLVKKKNYSKIEKPNIIISNCNLIFDFKGNIDNFPLIVSIANFREIIINEFNLNDYSIISNQKYIKRGTTSYPQYVYFTKEEEKFIRLSAYQEDMRITADGGLNAGTYATTPNDIRVTPSGLAAVGRYALPNRQPAIYKFEITPPPNTPIYFGTVKPNYGMCGGGVEVFFPTELPAGSIRLIGEIPIK